MIADATGLPFGDGLSTSAWRKTFSSISPEWKEIAIEANRALNEGGVFSVRALDRHCPIKSEIKHFYFCP